MKQARATSTRRRRRRPARQRDQGGERPARRLQAGDRRVPRGDRAPARHRRAPAGHRPLVDGDRPPLLRDGAVPAGGRGLHQRRPRARPSSARCSTSSRGSTSASATSSAPSARSRCSPIADPEQREHRRRHAPPRRPPAPRRRVRQGAQALRGVRDAVRSDAREGRRRSSTRRATSGVYYDKLSQQQLDVLDQNDAAPAARRPLGARGRGRAAGVRRHRRRERVQDAHHAVDAAHREAQRCSSYAPNRVRAFPELQAGEETALALINRISRARLDARAGRWTTRSRATSPARSARFAQQRRALRRPSRACRSTRATSPSATRRACASGTRLSQELTQRDRPGRLRSRRRSTASAACCATGRSTASRAIRPSVQRFEAELDANEHDLKLYRDEIDRASPPDRARARADRLRRRALPERRGGARSVPRRARPRGAARVAGAARAAARRATRRRRARSSRRRASTKTSSSAPFAQLEAQVAQRVGELQQKIDTERVNIAGYQQQLDALDGEARDLVGQVAKRNFGLVRDRLRGIVLRADVGITEQAWEVREEELDRVRNLQIGARARRAAARRRAQRGARRRRRRTRAAEQVTWSVGPRIEDGDPIFEVDGASASACRGRGRALTCAAGRGAAAATAVSPAIAATASAQARAADARRRDAARDAASQRRRPRGDAAAARRGVGDRRPLRPPAAPVERRADVPSARCRRSRRRRPQQIAAFEATAAGGRRRTRRARRTTATAITTIIKLHYEEKKKAILGGLDREIAIEKEELKKAREIGDPAPRGVRRQVQRRERAARGHARRDVPPRRALRGARALRRRPNADLPSTA